VPAQLEPEVIYIAVPASVALGGLTALLYFLKKRSERRKP
jgi:hypothetical protein